MRRSIIGGLILIVLFAAGCGSPTPPDSPDSATPASSQATDDGTSTGDNAGQQTTTQRGNGALGSPLDFDPGLQSDNPTDAVDGVNAQLTDHCGSDRCDVTVGTSYQGGSPGDQNCLADHLDYAHPLRRGATITIVVICSTDTTTATTESSDSTSSTGG